MSLVGGLVGCFKEIKNLIPLRLVDLMGILIGAAIFSVGRVGPFLFQILPEHLLLPLLDEFAHVFHFFIDLNGDLGLLFESFLLVFDHLFDFTH